MDEYHNIKVVAMWWQHCTVQVLRLLTMRAMSHLPEGFQYRKSLPDEAQVFDTPMAVEWKKQKQCKL